MPYNLNKQTNKRKLTYSPVSLLWIHRLYTLKRGSPLHAQKRRAGYDIKLYQDILEMQYTLLESGK